MKLPELKQSPVTFRSEDHTYWLGDKELQGITSTLINFAYPDTYKKPDRYTDEEWKEVLDNAAAKGSVMHETIELYDELGIDSDLPELKSYISIVKENNLTVLATEYLVSDEEHFATAIDKIFVTPEGKIILVDFKRTSVKHYDNVALQLSICKRFFELNNPDLKVEGCYLMWLRDDKSEFRNLAVWPDEMLDDLIDSYLTGKSFDIQKTYGTLPMKFAEVEDEVARLEMAVKVAQERQKELKQGLYELMEENNIKAWTGAKVKLTRVLPQKKVSFDSKAFKEKHPDLYKEFCKESEVAGSLRITVNKS